MYREKDGNYHGVLLYSSNGNDILVQPRSLTFRTIGGIIDLYVFPGPTPADVMSQYTKLIGKLNITTYRQSVYIPLKVTLLSNSSLTPILAYMIISFDFVPDFCRSTSFTSSVVSWISHVSLGIHFTQRCEGCL
jgi:hypothetical protein